MESMNITRIRRLRRLTQVELAEMAGLSQSSVSRAEKGEGGTTLHHYQAIAAALNVPLWELFSDSMSVEELTLLDIFRRLDPERQRGWIDMARALSQDRQEPS